MTNQTPSPEETRDEIFDFALSVFGFLLTFFVVTCFLYVVSWQIKWIKEMQVLNWEVRVSEVAKFTCNKTDNPRWVTNSYLLHWECTTDEIMGGKHD